MVSSRASSFQITPCIPASSSAKRSTRTASPFDELATRVDQPVQLIDALLNEQCPVTRDLAHAIEAVFGGGDPQSLQVIARRPTAEGAEAD